MEIIFKSYHANNIDDKTSINREISGDFNEIVEKMLEKIVENLSEKRFKTESDGAEVATCIKDIMYIQREEDKERIFSKYANRIARRLLREEVKVQQRVGHLKGVQRGSLVQALIKIEDNKYKYLIAKVEHKNFVEEIELILKGGFNPEENKIWKTCIFSCEVDEDEVDVSEARVYLNNPASYWTERFLELVELKSDEKNTRDAWKAINDTLAKELKKNATSDYFVLRNAIISYFRRTRMIDYISMIEEIFGEYEPIDVSIDKMADVKAKVLRLPEDKCFDSNFISKPKEVKAKIKSVHKVNKDIDIIIREGLSEDVNNYKNIIHVESRENGERWLVINATDPETLRMFDINR